MFQILWESRRRVEILEVVLNDEAGMVALDQLWEGVLSSIGLRKAPLPFLMAGVGAVELEASDVPELAYEYLTVSPTQIVRYEGPSAWVLCIENMTTFVLAAKRWPARLGGLLLFTGGMPSPT
ncbi:hypothetical protein [Novilysobacter selenitireducens]|uniref:Uncharacterized protein n=1 Tax=Novilysobacter selenitireducens TaxID=2872639 RepID=A0ABS7T2G9_9GAMM|nr:hypothetical protein [Lysobacter selenitireducens]MBZ4038067.1 hypothetical protein [Lysobacter selenitireducens]